MTIEELISRGIENELIFSASRSSGPGGQNVNKTNTKVELRFKILSSSHLSGDEKEFIFDRLRNRITADGEMVMSCQTERTQIMNKRAVTHSFFRLLAMALTPAPERIATKPGKASKLKRLDEKRIRSIIKKQRNNRNLDTDN